MHLRFQKAVVRGNYETGNQAFSNTFQIFDHTGSTGYAINLARNLGLRVGHAFLLIAGKGTADWGYAPTPTVGPLLGGALAGVLLRAFNIH
jgi:glycerol uptake facilitator-like aquaporin